MVYNKQPQWCSATTEPPPNHTSIFHCEQDRNTNQGNTNQIVSGTTRAFICSVRLRSSARPISPLPATGNIQSISENRICIRSSCPDENRIVLETVDAIDSIRPASFCTMIRYRIRNNNTLSTSNSYSYPHEGSRLSSSAPKAVLALTANVHEAVEVDTNVEYARCVLLSSFNPKYA